MTKALCVLALCGNCRTRAELHVERELASSARSEATPPRASDSVTSSNAAPAVEPVPEIADISLSHVHACVRTASGRIRCWGPTQAGDVIGDDEPPACAGWVDLPGPAVDVSAGLWSHAVLDDGSLWRWLGVSGPAEQVDVGEAVAEVHAQDLYACALLVDGGRVKCWGRGIGALGRPEYRHRDIGDDPDETPAQLEAIELGGPAESLAAGSYHACALMADHSVRCWGQGWVSGTLGYGDENNIGDDEHPRELPPVPLGGPIEQLSSYGTFTCALREDRRVLCWGRNDYGQLGLATDERAIGNDEPVVPHGIVRALDEVEIDTLAAGRDHLCVLTSAGRVSCWGHNNVGQLGSIGVGDLADVGLALETRRSVLLPGPARAIASGSNSTCALLETGALVCWGAFSHMSYGRAIAPQSTPLDLGHVPLFVPCP